MVMQMEEEIPEYEEYCSECGEKTRKKFVSREDEHMVYECSMCGYKEKIGEEEIDEELEEAIEEWEEEWEE